MRSFITCCMFLMLPAMGIGQTPGDTRNDIFALTSKLRSLVAAGIPITSPDFEQIVIERYGLLRRLSREGDVSYLQSTLDPSLSKILPTQLQEYCEHLRQVKGQLRMMVMDNFLNAKCKRFYHLQNASGAYRLIVDDSKASSYVNTDVVVDGYEFDSIVVSTTLRPAVSGATSPRSVPPQGPFRVLCLLVRYPSSPQPGYSSADFRNLALSDTAAIRGFFRETSYGKAEMTGNVYGWITLPDSLLSDTTGMYGQDRPYPFLNELSTIARDSSIDLSKFDNVLWIQLLPNGWSAFNGAGGSLTDREPWPVNGQNFNLAFSWVLTGTVLNRNQGLQGSYPLGVFEEVICHELGHTMGLLHAGGWAGSPDDDWSKPWDQRVDAVNPFDLMGYRPFVGGSFNFNALFKLKLGWIDSSSVLRIRSSGDYVIRPLELQSGVRAAEIRNSDASGIYVVVECRGKFGFDININSVNTHGILGNTSWDFIGISENDHPSYMVDPILFDFDTITVINPGWDMKWDASALRGNNRWNITRAGFALGPIISASDSSVEFHVEISKTIGSILRNDLGLPTTFSLSQNYPNPFNPTTTLRYGLPHQSNVTLIVYNTLGQWVATLVQGQQEAGSYEVKFDGSGLASGIYFYRLQAGTYVDTKKLLLLK